MHNKHHQAHERSYQIRVDGVAVYFPSSIDKEALNKYAELCNKHEDCYVDIVRINTEILMSQSEYYQMERHFKND